MKKTITVFMMLASSLLFSQTEKTNKAREVIYHAIDAKGGLEVLESIKTLYSNSETVMDGRNVNWITKELAPNKGRFEIVYQGRTVYASFYDGKTGYEIINGQKTLADQESFKDKNFRKHIINELDYLDPNLYQLEYLGTEKVNGNDCDKIKASLVNGKISYLYYDKKSHLMLKNEVVKNLEKGSFTTIIYNGFKKFGNLTYETEYELISEEGSQKAKIIDLKYNEGITDNDFK